MPLSCRGVFVDRVPAGGSSVPEEPLHGRGIARIPKIRIQIVPDEVEELVSFSDEIFKSNRFKWQEGVKSNIEWEIGKDWYSLEPLKL